MLVEGRVWYDGLDGPAGEDPGPSADLEQACHELSGHRRVQG